MWHFKYSEDYYPLVADLDADDAVQSMRALPQHAPGVSCYHHSVLVSYLSYRICRRFGLDARAAARASRPKRRQMR